MKSFKQFILENSIDHDELVKQHVDDIQKSGRYTVGDIKSSSKGYYKSTDIQVIPEKPEGAVEYKNLEAEDPQYEDSVNTRNKKTTSWYNPKYATLERNSDIYGQGKSVARVIPKLKPDSELSPSFKPESDGLIWRGMSHEEYQNIQKTGKIKSKGDYNLEGQEGLTYFSTRPSAAESYAHSFAPIHFKASASKPAYIIGVKNPRTGVHIPGTGEHEVGIPHEISASDIVEVHKGIPYAAHSGSSTVMSSPLDKNVSETGASIHIGWKRIK